ncbi:MAG: metallophosphoesterase [Pseudomonadota bacterium]
MSLFRKLFGPKPAPEAPPPLPEAPFYAIGDIHGRADLLQALVAQIEGEDPAARLVFVGDYIDRGEQTRAVLDWLQAYQARASARHPVFLMGNHERMCLDFIDNPEAAGARWLRNGGLQALASYGVGMGAQQADLAEMHRDLVAAMGEATLAWLRGLALSWRSGNVAVVHAALDPVMSFTMQPESVLLWGHPAFLRRPRGDGLWVVHGHTIVDAPYAAQGRIAVDTGAYGTGRLSAARIGDGQVRFLST